VVHVVKRGNGSRNDRREQIGLVKSPLITVHLDVENGMALRPLGSVYQSITTSSLRMWMKFAVLSIDTSVHLDA
ncbi:hypothetical protein DIPPA_07779, partial [Diplonema papillatum]